MSDETNDGILGESTDGDDTVQPASHSSSSWKVLGETDASDGTGVIGHNTSGSGVTTGVEGVVDSSDPDAVGVVGSAFGDNMGVLAQVYDDKSSLLDLADSQSAGIYGRTDKTTGFGIAGHSNNSNGIVGQSDDSNSYGIVGNNTAGGYALGADGDAEVNGDLDVTGSVSSSEVGARLKLSSTQTIPDGGTQNVAFDTTTTDHFNGSFSAGAYYPGVDGSFHVEAQVLWDGGKLPSGSTVDLTLRMDSDIIHSARYETEGMRTHHFGVTAFDYANPRTELEIRLYSGDDQSKDLDADEQDTYMTIHKVG